MAGQIRLLYFCSVFLLSSLTSTYCDEVNIKTVPYTPEGVYAVGDVQIRVDSIVAVANYRYIVSCPDYSGSNVDDIVDILERYRCPAGKGDSFDPIKYKSPEVYMKWGGWHDCVRELDPKGFFHCQEAHDGLSHGCASGDAMHCVHIKSRKIIPELRIGSRVNTKIEIAYYDSVSKVQKHSTDSVAVGKIRIRPKVTSDWPNQMAFNDKGAFIDDTLKAAAYAAANCPVYKPYNETEWIINRSKFHVNYVVDLGWDIQMDWYGPPKGSIINTVTQFDNSVEVRAPITTGNLEITGPKEAVAYLKENTSKDCEVVYCKQANIGEGIGIDALQGHKGRPVMILAVPRANQISSSRADLTGCEIQDEVGARYIVQPSKKTVLFTMAQTLTSSIGTTKCPPISNSEYDEFYGFEMKEIKTSPGASISVSSVLEDIRLPNIFNTKNILLTCAVVVALYFRLNYIGLVIAMVIGFVAMSQPAAALDPGLAEILYVSETCMTPISWVTKRTLARLCSIMLCLITIRNKRRFHAATSLLINSTSFWSDNIEYSSEIGLILTLVYYKVQDPKFQDWMEDIIDKFEQEAHYITGKKQPLLQPVIPPMAPIEHSYIGKSRKTNYYCTFRSNIDQEHKTRYVDTDIIIVTRSPNTIDRAKRAMMRRRQGIKAFNKHILYEEEFIALREELLKLDQSTIARVYATAIRVHGRKPWDLNTFLQCIRNTETKNRIIERASKEYW